MSQRRIVGFTARFFSITVFGAMLSGCLFNKDSYPDSSQFYFQDEVQPGAVDSQYADPASAYNQQPESYSDNYNDGGQFESRDNSADSLKQWRERNDRLQRAYDQQARERQARAKARREATQAAKTKQNSDSSTTP